MTYNFTPPAVKESDFKPIPPGTYPARCVKIIDLGTQEIQFEGEVHQKRQIKVVWEIPSEKKVFSEEKGLQPYVVSGRYTLSYHKKSKFLPMVESWLGKPVASDFFLPDLLGKTCLISVANQDTQDGKTYAKVMSVSPLMKGMEVEPQISPTVWFYMDSEKLDREVFDSLTKWEKESIEKSPEYANSDLGKRDSFLDAVK